MIRFLEGVLEEKEDLGVIINVQGVGYGLSCSRFTQEELPGTGETVRLLVYHHITDSDQRLFGFNNVEEKIIGMNLSEAQDLLDSLRGKERLLPYTETSPSKQRDGRDW